MNVNTLCAKCSCSPKSNNPFPECSKCHEIRYCSRECQVNDWKRHKTACADSVFKAKSFIDGALLNSSLFAFMLALLSRFEVYGRPVGYIKCVLYKAMIGDLEYFNGFITYIKGTSQHMIRGKNLILLEYTYNNHVYEKPMNSLYQLCDESRDVFVSLGYRLSAIKEGRPVKFVSDTTDFFEVEFIEGLKAPK